MVEIIYRRGALVVTARGIAMADGRKGAVITALNTSSGRTVTGRVAGPGLLEVGPVNPGGTR